MKIYIVLNDENRKPIGAFLNLEDARKFNDLCSAEHMTFRGEYNYHSIVTMDLRDSNTELDEIHSVLSELDFKKKYAPFEKKREERIIDGKLFIHESKYTEEELQPRNDKYEEYALKAKGFVLSHNPKCITKEDFMSLNPKSGRKEYTINFCQDCKELTLGTSNICPICKSTNYVNTGDTFIAQVGNENTRLVYTKKVLNKDKKKDKESKRKTQGHCHRCNKLLRLDMDKNKSIDGKKFCNFCYTGIMNGDLTKLKTKLFCI